MYHYLKIIIYSVGLQALLKPPAHQISWQLEETDQHKLKDYGLLHEVGFKS